MTCGFQPAQIPAGLVAVHVFQRVRDVGRGDGVLGLVDEPEHFHQPIADLVLQPPLLNGVGRRGEIAGLRWANVDLNAKTVTVSENRVAVGKEIMSGTPKSKASTRTLPMPDEVVEVLRAARKTQAEERLAFGAGYGSGEYVASDEAGQPYHPNLLTFRWGRMLDGLDIERVRLHDARHSCATLMHLRGVPIAVIAAWLGHASAAFTLSVYAHSQDDALQAAAGSFGRVVTTRDTETGSAR